MIECFLKIQSSTSSISIYKHLYNLCFTASAIECFECNSRDPDPNIADKCKNSPSALMSMPQYYKNCSDASARCRKIQQEGEFGGWFIYRKGDGYMNWVGVSFLLFSHFANRLFTAYTYFLNRYLAFLENWYLLILLCIVYIIHVNLHFSFLLSHKTTS